MLLETLKLALVTIWRNALRSVLTLLGVTIGVAAVIALLTLGQGTTAEVSSSITSLGSNLLVVRPGQLSQGPNGLLAPNFHSADAEAIARQVPSIEVVAPLAATSMTAVVGAAKHYTQVYGVDNNFFVARQWQVAEGLVLSATPSLYPELPRASSARLSPTPSSVPRIPSIRRCG